ncbi:MAG: flagellar hook-length control protein FliK [Planctomycetes bacterium]|nr:flagellar hook-length control protein FliK [Planctomycetota bacterium]
MNQIPGLDSRPPREGPSARRRDSDTPAMDAEFAALLSASTPEPKLRVEPPAEGAGEGPSPAEAASAPEEPGPKPAARTSGASPETPTESTPAPVAGPEALAGLGTTGPETGAIVAETKPRLAATDPLRAAAAQAAKSATTDETASDMPEDADFASVLADEPEVAAAAEPSAPNRDISERLAVPVAAETNLAGDTSPAAATRDAGLPPVENQPPAGQPVSAQRPTTETPPPTATEVIEQVRLQVRPGLSRINFRLDPPELGRLTIRLVLRRGRLVGEIRAESLEVSRVLENGLDRLRETIREAGVQVESLELRSDTDSALTSDSGQAGKDRSEALPANRRRISSLEVALPARPATASAPTNDQLLDLMA